jgi:hypothetical protein
MPKAPSSPTKAKTEPYDKTSPKKQSASSSVKDEPDDNTAHGNGKTSPAKKGGKGGGKVTWTPEMDRKVMVHILKHSKIDLVFNWAELQKEEFPDLTVIQVRSITTLQSALSGLFVRI